MLRHVLSLFREERPAGDDDDLYELQVDCHPTLGTGRWDEKAARYVAVELPAGIVTDDGSAGKSTPFDAVPLMLYVMVTATFVVVTGREMVNVPVSNPSMAAARSVACSVTAPEMKFCAGLAQYSPNALVAQKR